MRKRNSQPATLLFYPIINLKTFENENILQSNQPRHSIRSYQTRRHNPQQVSDCPSGIWRQIRKLLRLQPYRQHSPPEVLPRRPRPCRPLVQTQRIPRQVLSGHQRTGHRKFHLTLNLIAHEYTNIQSEF